MAQAGFQQCGILIEILLFRWEERRISVKSVFAELGRELGVLGYVLLWWSEVHQAHIWAHGSLIDCINNNMGSEHANSPAVICVSHRAHPQLPRRLFERWQSPKPSLAKKVWNWQEPLSNLFSTAEFPYPPGKCLMCCECFIGSFPGATYTQLPPIPAGSCAPGKWAWKFRKTHTSSQSSHNSSVLSS